MITTERDEAREQVNFCFREVRRLNKLLESAAESDYERVEKSRDQANDNLNYAQRIYEALIAPPPVYAASAGN